MQKRIFHVASQCHGNKTCRDMVIMVAWAKIFNWRNWGALLCPPGALAQGIVLHTLNSWLLLLHLRQRQKTKMPVCRGFSTH